MTVTFAMMGPEFSLKLRSVKQDWCLSSQPPGAKKLSFGNSEHICTGLEIQLNLLSWDIGWVKKMAPTTVENSKASSGKGQIMQTNPLESEPKINFDTESLYEYQQSRQTN